MEEEIDHTTKLQQCLESTEPFPTAPGQRWCLCSIQPNHVLNEHDAQLLLNPPGESDEEKEQARNEWIANQQQREGYLREVCHSIADSVKLAFSRQKQEKQHEQSPRVEQDTQTQPERQQQKLEEEGSGDVPEIVIVTREQLLTEVSPETEDEPEKAAQKGAKKGAAAKKGAGGKSSGKGGGGDLNELLSSVDDEHALVLRLVKYLDKVRVAQKEALQGSGSVPEAQSAKKGAGKGSGSKGKTEQKQKQQSPREIESHKEAADRIVNQIHANNELPATLVIMLDYPLSARETNPLMKGAILDKALHICLEAWVVVDMKLDIPEREEEASPRDKKSTQKQPKKKPSKSSKDLKSMASFQLPTDFGRDMVTETNIIEYIVNRTSKNDLLQLSDVCTEDINAVRALIDLGTVQSTEALPDGFPDTSLKAIELVFEGFRDSVRYDTWRDSVEVIHIPKASDTDAQELSAIYQSALEGVNDSSLTVGSILFALRETTVSYVAQGTPIGLHDACPDDPPAQHNRLVYNIDPETWRSCLYCSAGARDNVQHSKSVSQASKEIDAVFSEFAFLPHLSSRQNEKEREHVSRETERECFVGDGATTQRSGGEYSNTITQSSRHRLLFADICRDFERVLYAADALHMCRSIHWGYPSVRPAGPMEWLEKAKRSVYGAHRTTKQIACIAHKPDKSQLLDFVGTVNEELDKLRFENKREVHKWSLMDWNNWRLMNASHGFKKMANLLSRSHTPQACWAVDGGHGESMSIIHKTVPRSRHEVEYFDCIFSLCSSVALTFSQFRSYKNLLDATSTNVTDLDMSSFADSKSGIRSCSRTDWLFPCDDSVIRIDHCGCESRTEGPWMFGVSGRRLTVDQETVILGCMLPAATAPKSADALAADSGSMFQVAPEGIGSGIGTFFAEFDGIGSRASSGALPPSRLNMVYDLPSLPRAWYLEKPGRKRLKRWLKKNSDLDTSSPTWLEQAIKDGKVLEPENDIRTLKPDGCGHIRCEYASANSQLASISTNGTVSYRYQDNSLRSSPKWPEGFVEIARKIVPEDGSVIRHIESVDDNTVTLQHVVLPNSKSILFIPLRSIPHVRSLFMAYGVDVSSITFLDSAEANDSFITITFGMEGNTLVRMKNCSVSDVNNAIAESVNIIRVEENGIILSCPASTVAVSQDSESLAVIHLRYELTPMTSDIQSMSEVKSDSRSDAQPRYDKAKDRLLLEHIQQHLSVEHKAELERVSGTLWKTAEGMPYVFGDEVKYPSYSYNRVIYVEFADMSTLAIFPDETFIFRVAMKKSSSDVEFKGDESEHVVYQRALITQRHNPTLEVDLPFERDCSRHIQGYEYTSSFAAMRTRFVVTLPDGTIISCDYDPCSTTLVNGRLRLHRQDGDIVLGYDDGYIEYRPHFMDDPARALESGVGSIFFGRKSAVTTSGGKGDEGEDNGMKPAKDAGIYKFMLPTGEFKVTDDDNNVFYLNGAGGILTGIAGALETSGSEDDLRVIFPRIAKPMQPHLFWFDRHGNAAELLSPKEWESLLMASHEAETAASSNELLGADTPSVSSIHEGEDGVNETEVGHVGTRLPLKNRHLIFSGSPDKIMERSDVPSAKVVEPPSIKYHSILTPIMESCNWLGNHQVGVIDEHGKQYISRCNFGWIEFSDKHVQSLLKRSRVSRKEIFGENARPVPPWIEERSDATALARLKQQQQQTLEDSIAKRESAFNSIVLKIPTIASNAPVERKRSCLGWALQYILSAPQLNRSQRQALELDEQAVEAWRGQIESTKAQFETSDDRTPEQLDEERRYGLYLKYLRLAAGHQKRISTARSSRVSARSSGKRTPLRSLKSSSSPPGSASPSASEGKEMPSIQEEFESKTEGLSPSTEKEAYVTPESSLLRSHVDPSYWAHKMDNTKRQAIREQLKQQYQVPQASNEEQLYARAVEAAARQASLYDTTETQFNNQEVGQSPSIDYSLSSESDVEEKSEEKIKSEDMVSRSPRSPSTLSGDQREDQNLYTGADAAVTSQDENVDVGNTQALEGVGSPDEDLDQKKNYPAQFSPSEKEDVRPPRPGSVRSSGSHKEYQALHIQPRVLRFAECEIGGTFLMHITVRNVHAKPLRIRIDAHHLEFKRGQTSIKAILEGGSYIPPGVSHQIAINLYAKSLGQFKDSLEIQYSTGEKFVGKSSVRVSAIVVPSKDNNRRTAAEQESYDQ
eukprot:gb/GECG01005520.1/.p1 GENE.gb/GECG01005520.1/~~gb/GECG01005520.1/.p1  ORF type:complete len:2190 (+),score=309.36 gb/GECG01005520.1/:1-6570(+)